MSKDGKKIKITLGADSCDKKSNFEGYQAKITGTKTAYYKLPDAKRVARTSTGYRNYRQSDIDLLKILMNDNPCLESETLQIILEHFVTTGDGCPLDEISKREPSKTCRFKLRCNVDFDDDNKDKCQELCIKKIKDKILKELRISKKNGK
jgi:hypothetical protein